MAEEYTTEDYERDLEKLGEMGMRAEGGDVAAQKQLEEWASDPSVEDTAG